MLVKYVSYLGNVYCLMLGVSWKDYEKAEPGTIFHPISGPRMARNLKQLNGISLLRTINFWSLSKPNRPTPEGAKENYHKHFWSKIIISKKFIWIKLPLSI